MASCMSVGTGQRGVSRQGHATYVRASLSSVSSGAPTVRGKARGAPTGFLTTRLNVSTLEPPSTTAPATEHVMWYDKFSGNWTSPQTYAELQDILRNEKERMIFIDLYSTFCPACKAAFPQLSRVAGNSDFQKDFIFVKCCVTDDGMQDFVRENGITGIPTALVCAPGGKKLISFGASFRKINAVKANLVVMAANRSKDFMIDPNGFVVPRP